jgi:hypothetical protein
MSDEIRGGLATAVRRLASRGIEPRVIAKRYGLNVWAVRRFLKTPPKKERYAHGPARRILGQTGTRVRDLIGRGWQIPDIAEALELDEDRVRNFAKRIVPVRRGSIVKPRTQAEQERLEANLRKNRPEPRPKRIDEWKLAALVDPRYQDPVTPQTPVAPLELAPAAAAIVAELPDQAGAAERTEAPPAAVETHQSRVTESWGHWNVRGEKHGAARLSEDNVREIRRKHAAGYGLAELGWDYEVSPRTIHAIVRRESWAHVE